MEGSGEAIEAGKLACKGKTPLQVKEDFIDRSDLEPEQLKMVARLRVFEKASGKSPNFAAGQLGALVYGSTLSGPTSIYGFQGCVYSLARVLERKLAPHGGR